MDWLKRIIRKFKIRKLVPVRIDRIQYELIQIDTYVWDQFEKLARSKNKGR